MIQKIKALFSAPVFEGDLEKTLKARELTNILNVLLSGTVIFTALMPVFAGRLPPRWYFVLPLYLICLGGHWLMRRGQVQISGWFLVLGLWLAVTSAEITQGGVKSSIFVGNLVVILGAAILDGFGHALGYFALTFFKGLLLILAEEYGYLPPPMEFVESSRLILLTQLFIAAMVVAFLRMATMGMRLSLAHAHRELVERRLMEKSLLESEQRYRLLYETEQKQAQELALEGQVRTAMAQELDLPFLLRNIVESIADSYGYTLVSVYLLEGNTLYLQHQVGYAKTIPKITLGKGVISRSVLSREPVLLEDVRTDPQFLGAIENLVSEICIPLFDEGRVVGALNVESTQDTKLTESDLKLLTGLGEHVSLAIRQARLYSGLQRQNRILSALEEATLVLMRRLDLTEVLGTIVSQAARIMDTPHGYLYLVQTDEHSMQMTVGTGVFADSMGKHLKPQEGLAGKVWMSGQPLNIPLYHTWTGRSPQYSDIEFHAVVGVPLTSQAHVVGVTGLAYVEPGRIFSDEDIELLSHFAKLASIALENARLYSLAQQELVERSRAEEALKQAETLYRTLVEQTSIVVYRDAPDGSGTPLYISPQIETLLGYSVEEWLSDPSFWQRVIHPEDLPRVLESLGHCLSAEGKSSIEYRMRRKNGAWCWVRDETLTVKDADGNAQFVHGVFMDISDRKQAEEILRMFQYSVEQSMDAIFWMVRDGGFTYVNEKACSSLGYTREELLGLHLWDIDPIYPRELWDSNWDGYQPEHRGGGEHVETLHRRKNGSTFPVEVFSKHLWFGDRELHVAVVRDISEHKQAQATLRESEERYRTLAEAAQDMIFIISGNGTIEYVNESAAQKFTLLPEELVGRSMAELFPEDVAGRQWKNVQMVFNTGKPVYIENATMFGVQEVWLGTTLTPIKEQDGRTKAVLGVSRDITERKQLDNSIRKSEENIRAFIELSEDAIWNMVFEEPIPVDLPESDLVERITKEARIAECNLAFARLYGHESVEQARAIPKMQWTDIDFQVFQELVRNNFSLKDFESKEILEGRAFHFASTINSIIRDGKLIALWGTIRDISAGKRAEHEREQLIANLESKNTELERYAYAVSHDLKSPLVTIRGFLGFVEQDSRDGDSARLEADIRRIKDATDRMQRLLRELTELARIGHTAGQHESIPFNDLVQEALGMVHAQLEAGGVNVRIQADLPQVYGDRVRLVEVLQNLLENAVKYIGNQPDPEIEIGVRRDGASDIFFVRDNGMGIDPQYHDRVFELFEKLDANTEGTGIGLAIVKRIIEIHGGRIWLESRVGEGATFFFTVSGADKGGA